MLRLKETDLSVKDGRVVVAKNNHCKHVKKSKVAKSSHLEIISLKSSKISIDNCLSEGYLSFTWEGARMMTLNKIIRAGNYNRLTPYRKAWHKACHDAFLLSGVKKKDFFVEPVKVKLTRRAKRRVDPDALAAMFKFCIDGIRDTGLILDDTPDYITEIIPDDGLGDYSVSITIYRA